MTVPKIATKEDLERYLPDKTKWRWQINSFSASVEVDTKLAGFQAEVVFRIPEGHTPADYKIVFNSFKNELFNNTKMRFVFANSKPNLQTLVLFYLCVYDIFLSLTYVLHSSLFIWIL